MALADITLPLDASAPVWPGDEAYACGWTARMSDGAACNIGWTRGSVHNGTHMDAPLHFRDDGLDAAGVPLDDLVGPCVLLEAHGCGVIEPKHLADVDLQRSERILIRTRPARYDPWKKGYAAVSPDAARLLAESEVRCVGTDAPSMDGKDSKGLESHRILDAGGVRILENLALWGPAPGRYELLALPTRLVGLDGAPVRAALRPV